MAQTRTDKYRRSEGSNHARERGVEADAMDGKREKKGSIRAMGAAERAKRALLGCRKKLPPSPI